MAKYRKIDPRIWNDAKFGSLCDHGKLAFLFLLTHPHMTSLGAMRANVPGLAAELGWSEKAFREAFTKVCSKGMARHDERVSLVWLPKFIRYNPPENPNVLKAWAGAVDMIPECPMKNEILHGVKDFTEGLSESFGKGLPEAFSKPMPNQEPEPEPEPEPEKPPSSPGDDGLDEAFEWFWSAGMRKVDKKKARAAFATAVKRLKVDPGDFAARLHDDVKARLQAQQLGFDALHPTTYLNGERWNDEIQQGTTRGRRLSPSEEVEQAIAERDRARAEGDGLGMAEDDRDVRGPVGTGAGQGSTYDMDSGDWEA